MEVGRVRAIDLNDLDGPKSVRSFRRGRHPMTMLLAVMLAGALGVGLRYGLNIWITEHAGPGFPWATLLINVVGCAAIGLVAFAADATGGNLHGTQVPIAVGLLGGFTTFSSYALEAVTLAADGAAMRALAYVVVSNVAGLIGAGIGVAGARAL
jgi:CrcB protein